MTTIDRFDPFEQRITAAIDEIAAPRRPDYLDDILRQTARTSQRPRWTFPERWLHMDTAVPRSSLARRLPVQSLVLLIILALIAVAATAVWVGSQRRVPPPFGPAANGSIAYTANGDIYVREALDAQPRLLLGGPGDDAYPFYSPDGRRFAFSTTIDGKEYLKVADADGSNARQLLPDPLIGASAYWMPDSAALGVVTEISSLPKLLIVPVDGSEPRAIDLGTSVPLGDAVPRPPDGRQLILRVQQPDGHIDLMTVDPITGQTHALGIPGDLLFGIDYEASGPVWSPDGSRIAYNRVEPAPSGDEPSGRFSVHLVNPDGTGDRAMPAPADDAVQEGWPLFSPDGRSILVHRWTWKSSGGGEGWLAVLPADGSAAATDIGPRIPGGEDTGLIKTWSPDGSRVLVRAENEQKVYSIDPATGDYEELPWTTELPDWQRVSP
ncbi:MAG: hypothetical protein MUQ32_06735 [Chloroflexi bacterium]|nr:hypothetical protein [Chloroflexota bacterium]